MGMKNHELVPAQLVESIAGLKRGSAFKNLQTLLKHKLLAHEGKAYDGYKLTYNGYDYLALRAFVKRGHLSGVGMRIGVGKESDIHVCVDEDGKKYALKLHRLGRVSFRSIKRNRDYLQHRQSASWMYLARLAAKKEYAYLQALYKNGFPVPIPVDHNRHAVLMEFMEAKPMLHVRQLSDPATMGEKMLRLILRFAQAGLIHGDFNEFNLMLTDEEELVVIDFPQVVSIEHECGEMYFERDVECVRDWLRRKFGVDLETKLTYAKGLEAFRKNAPAEKTVPDGGYDMPAKPQKVVVALPADDEKALAAAIKDARGDADRTADFEPDEDGADTENSDEEEETDAGGDDDIAAARSGIERLAFKPPPRAESASKPEPAEADGPSAPRDAQFVAVEVAEGSDASPPSNEVSEDEEDDEERKDAKAAPRRVELQHVLRVKRRTRGEEAIKNAAKKQREKATKSNRSKPQSKEAKRQKNEIRDAMTNY
jgi:RIO kinase 2